MQYKDVEHLAAFHSWLRGRQVWNWKAQWYMYQACNAKSSISSNPVKTTVSLSKKRYSCCTLLDGPKTCAQVSYTSQDFLHDPPNICQIYPLIQCPRPENSLLSQGSFLKCGSDQPAEIQRSTVYSQNIKAKTPKFLCDLSQYAVTFLLTSNCKIQTSKTCFSC